MSEHPIQWACFSSDPIRDPYGTELAGRKLHATRAPDEALESDLDGRAARCGRTPLHGWYVDLFNEKKCAQCLKAVDQHCTVCGGAGAVGLRGCLYCHSSGEREAQLATEAVRAELREVTT